MLMNKEFLGKMLDSAISNKKGITIQVKVPGNIKNEIIKNHALDVENKKEYYMNNYNEVLTHKYSPGVQIVGIVINE